MSSHDVTILSGLDDFEVKFFGPKDTPYEGGVWKVQVHLHENYPFKSPTVRFINTVSLQICLSKPQMLTTLIC